VAYKEFEDVSSHSVLDYEMKTAGCLKTSVPFNQTKRRHTSEVSNLYSSCRVNFKFYISFTRIVCMFCDAPYVNFPLTISHEKENVEIPGALLLEVRLSLPPALLHHPSTA
jgi:hypothetical protein